MLEILAFTAIVYFVSKSSHVYKGAAKLAVRSMPVEVKRKDTKQPPLS